MPHSQRRIQSHGEAGRVSQVIPDARPFSGALWAALTGAERDLEAGGGRAPPGMVPCKRFFLAASWLAALIDGDDTVDTLVPLRRRVFGRANAGRLPQVNLHIQFDASVWGGGAVLVRR